MTSQKANNCCNTFYRSNTRTKEHLGHYLYILPFAVIVTRLHKYVLQSLYVVNCQSSEDPGSDVITGAPWDQRS